MLKKMKRTEAWNAFSVPENGVVCVLRRCRRSRTRGAHFIWLQISRLPYEPKSVVTVKKASYSVTSLLLLVVMLWFTRRLWFNQVHSLWMDWGFFYVPGWFLEPKDFPWHIHGLLGPLRKQQNFNNLKSALIIDLRAKWSYCFQLGHLYATSLSNIFPI